MWSDTFLAIERAHFLRILAWGAACGVIGTALLALVAVRRQQRLPLLFHFALQTALWGAVDVALAAVALRQLRLPDYAAATQFDRFVWWSLGIDLGGAAVGVTLALSGWLLARRLGVVGAGLGVFVQGAALVAIDLVVVAQIGTTV